ncbi:MAG: branched-chain amino acid transport system substrate-binding [Actinobacteria bacterium]|nr:MAG: branched-chain amino acid transport system substrate-binding [Actinomycetota bacterium]MDO8949950.1 ABC transporter substrate-binding protein [Actinomycetota bacterium]
MKGQLKALLATVLILALCTFSLAGCAKGDGGAAGSGTGDSQAKDPYIVGAVLSLTGSYAGLGAPEQNAIEMEVARINEAGGIKGHPLKVIYEDDGTDPAKAVAATARLIDQENVIAIIGATGTGQSMGMRTEVDRAALPQVSVAGGTVITSDFDPLVFQTPWSNSLVVPYTMAYLKKQGITKIAIVTDTGGFGADGQAVLKAQAPKAGITITTAQTFNPGDTDMTSQLTKVKGTDSQAVVMWTAGKEAAIVAKNMLQLGMKVPLYGSHGNARTEFVEGAGAAAEGFHFAAGKILVPESYGEGTPAYEVATDFVKRYTAAYGKAPDTFAGHAYDAVNLIASAMGRLDEGFTSEELRAEIEKTSGFVGIGGTFTFSATDHNGLSAGDLVMYRVENGNWIVEK